MAVNQRRRGSGASGLADLQNVDGKRQMNKSNKPKTQAPSTKVRHEKTNTRETKAERTAVIGVTL